MISFTDDEMNEFVSGQDLHGLWISHFDHDTRGFCVPKEWTKKWTELANRFCERMPSMISVYGAQVGIYHLVGMFP